MTTAETLAYICGEEFSAFHRMAHAIPKTAINVSLIHQTRSSVRRKGGARSNELDERVLFIAFLHVDSPEVREYLKNIGTQLFNLGGLAEFLAPASQPTANELSLIGTFLLEPSMAVAA